MKLGPKIKYSKGILEALVSSEEFAQRKQQIVDLTKNHTGMGRELFTIFRDNVSAAEEGATSFSLPKLFNSEVF